MELTMSMFATPADYWKARAELAERIVQETAQELGCEQDNEAVLQRAHELRIDARAMHQLAHRQGATRLAQILDYDYADAMGICVRAGMYKGKVTPNAELRGAAQQRPL